MTSGATSPSLTALLDLLTGGSQQGAQQYPVQTSRLAGPDFMGPHNQGMQAMPQGLPPNIMAMWASMTSQERAQYMAATQGGMQQQAGAPGQQLASMGGRPPQSPGVGTNLSLTPEMLQMFAHLQPQPQYGNPMTMRAGNDQITALEQMVSRSRGVDPMNP